MQNFLSEVNEQGRALRTAVERYRDQEAEVLREAARLAAGRPLLFAGMGSSWAAALGVVAYLVRGGRAAVAVDASEALYRWLPVMGGPRGFSPVLISQSGESQEVVRIAARLAVPFIAITNRPESTLARRAAVVLALHAGHEEGVTSKTFLNTVAVGILLGRTLLEEGSEEKLLEMARLLEVAEFLEAAGAVEGILGRGLAGVQALHRHLAEDGAAPSAPAAPGGPAASGGPGAPPGSWDLISRGSGLAAVHQGALVLRELTGRVVAPFGGGLYRHGPVYRSGPWTRALVLAAREEEGDLLARLSRDVLERGGRVAFVSDFDPRIKSPSFCHLALPPVARSLFPIPAIVPLELLCIADAAARGLEPGVGAPKVTPVE